MKMYKTSKNSLLITEIEVIRHTDSYIWVNDWNNKPRRELRFSNYNEFFESWEYAKRHIVNREQRKFVWAKEALIRAEEDYNKALKLTQ